MITNETIFEEYLALNQIRPAITKFRSYDSDSQISSIGNYFKHKNSWTVTTYTGQHEIDYFEIVAGHRRYLACKFLRYKRIAVIIKDLSDIEAFEDQIIENIQRHSLNFIEEGQAFDQYVKNYGWGGVTKLSNILKKSEQYVSSRIQLLNLSKTVEDYVIKGDLTVSHALELLSLSKKDQETLVGKIIEKNLSIKEVRYIKQTR